jgi:MOSC domain-containing protein YiiM
VAGTVEAVCTGTVEEFGAHSAAGASGQGEVHTTAIRKSPVDGVRWIRTGTGVQGDEIANRDAHGGSLRTVYAYAAEDRAFWERQLGRDLPPGSFGENLATTGVDVTGAKPGERWRVGDALLEVTTIRTPCYKLAWALGEDGIERAFQRAARPGAYLTVVEEGEVEAGDDIRVVRTREDHDITLGTLAHAFHNDRRLRTEVLQDVDLLPPAVADHVVAMLRV